MSGSKSLNKIQLENLPELQVSGVSLNALLPAVLKAGDAILAVKSGELGVEIKADNSPVTAADKASNDILLAALEQHYPDIPVISEEAEASHAMAPSDIYFLVDPLDGTKEFIRPDSQGNFTVNIGLIADGEAVGGIVYAPMRDLLFWGVAGQASYLYTAQMRYTLSVETPVADRMECYPVAVASRSHKDAETAAFLQTYQIEDSVSVGSSVKFGILAMGVADIYPRFGPTMEWDTAAGEAVLRGAGGAVFTDDGQPHRYGKKDWRNNPFIACGKFCPF